jgi:hypothetical protein
MAGGLNLNKGNKMTTALVIGSEPTDLRNVKNTISILTDYLNLDNEKNTTTLSYNDIENLLDWYKGIHSVLTDFSLFLNSPVNI